MVRQPLRALHGIVSRGVAECILVRCGEQAEGVGGVAVLHIRRWPGIRAASQTWIG